jgi:nicotinic acid mononucleotide adenylyltransferase
MVKATFRRKVLEHRSNKEKNYRHYTVNVPKEIVDEWDIANKKITVTIEQENTLDIDNFKIYKNQNNELAIVSGDDLIAELSSKQLMKILELMNKEGD